MMGLWARSVQQCAENENGFWLRWSSDGFCWNNIIIIVSINYQDHQIRWVEPNGRESWPEPKLLHQPFRLQASRRSWLWRHRHRLPSHLSSLQPGGCRQMHGSRSLWHQSGSYLLPPHCSLITHLINQLINRCLILQQDDLRREAQMMSLVDHPNVLKAYCSFAVERSLWVVMQFMDEGSCLHLMKIAYTEGFEEEAIGSILKETLKALQYLHHHGHIHRDVKAGNILLGSSGAVKLADFGVAACLFDAGDRQRYRNTFVGTPCWYLITAFVSHSLSLYSVTLYVLVIFLPQDGSWGSATFKWL